MKFEKTTHSKTSSDACETLFRLLSGELDESIALVSRHLFAHQLAGRNIAELQRNQCSVTNLVFGSALYAEERYWNVE